MPSLSFHSPAVLLCLLGIPPLWFLWRRACRRALQVEDHLRGPERLTASSANAWRGLARLSALALLVTGLAGPSFTGVGSGPPTGAPVVFVLDVSASMTALDGAPDRLVAARAAVHRLCTFVPEARPALVVAGGAAAVVCPPTADREAFFIVLEQAGPTWMPAGTGLLPAIEAAQGVLEREGGAGAVVLVSDGEDHGPPPDEVLDAIRRGGGVVHTVVVGSPAGVRLPRPMPGEIGAPPVTQARPDAMASWARLGGGRAWSAPGGLPDRADLLIPRSVRLGVARRDGRLLDLSPWLCAAAVVMLAAAAVAGGHGRARTDTD